MLSSDGVYLSSHNKTFKALNLKKRNFKIIGSAHNIRQINFKIRQGCDYVLLSKLFTVDYDKAAPFLGIVKFNRYIKNVSTKLVPLGGIKTTNLNSLKNVNCDALALLSEIKKKPAKIFSRLF